MIQRLLLFKYRITFENRGETVEWSGFQVMTAGIPVRLETSGTSEMLLFESALVNAKSNGTEVN
jgi:hypothetical protein